VPSGPPVGGGGGAPTSSLRLTGSGGGAGSGGGGSEMDALLAPRKPAIMASLRCKDCVAVEEEEAEANGGTP